MLRNGSTEFTIPSADEVADVCSSIGPTRAADASQEIPGIRELVEALYPELRRIAQAHMRRERVDHTWQPTALVSEAFLKLAGQPGMQWRDRSHFLFAASKAMRLLLIDYARKHGAEKHGGSVKKINVADVQAVDLDAEKGIGYLELHELLKKMSQIDTRMASVVELKVFGGLTFVEIGEVLRCHERTAKRDWLLARAWLYGEMKAGNDSSGVGKD